jgi:hypothetical protein
MRSVRDWLHRWLWRAAAQCSTCLSWDWALPCHICAWIRFGSHREQLRAAPFLLRAALHSALRARGALAAAFPLPAAAAPLPGLLPPVADWPDTKSNEMATP